jgi:hypothetical protein
MGTKWVVIMLLIMMSAGCAIQTRELFLDSLKDIDDTSFRVTSVDTLREGRKQYYRVHVIVKEKR